MPFSILNTLFDFKIILIQSIRPKSENLIAFAYFKSDGRIQRTFTT